jgi:titin
MEDRTLLSTFSVTTPDDNGDDSNPVPGSFRQAIIDANGHPNDPGQVDQISFAIPGSGVQTIRPLSGLPRITDPVVIDGYSQPGAHPNMRIDGDDAALRIEIDGSLAGVASGLEIDAGSSTVRGLVINRFQFHGIVLTTNGSDAIEGNFIGTDASGTVPLGNGHFGIWIISGLANRIGTDGNGVDDPGERNVIAANGVGSNDGAGVRIEADFTVVAGNFIGIDATGTRPLGNRIGVHVLNSLDDPTTPHSVRIGTDADGRGDVAERNIISGNEQDGVEFGIVSLGISLG